MFVFKSSLQGFTPVGIGAAPLRGLFQSQKFNFILYEKARSNLDSGFFDFILDSSQKIPEHSSLLYPEWDKMLCRYISFLYFGLGDMLRYKTTQTINRVRFKFLSFGDDDKKTKCFHLAPIAVEILVDWGSVHKIVTKSGTILVENANVLLQKLIIELISILKNLWEINYREEI